MKKLILLTCCLLAFALPGCESTDEGTQLKPAVAKTFDKVADVTEDALPVLGGVSLFWPPASAIAGIVGGLLVMWRKLKPQVTTARDEAEFYGSLTKALVVSIEMWRKERPDEWEYLGDKLSEVIGTKADAVIRALIAPSTTT